ncbi:hypothetical protein PV10_08173 [Exophiala mesophila]|uniref:Pre-rRNA-processing protein IPI3 n=1 Tax=Exophiala mesophila TaxID=212818 RepID=A0A0D1XJY4_EXOME|nr:uncharacterized protein PV10_08173 [Exophiala mesophila]KIV88491.1 hypothetical protein PV10_08173 [Exophiala mesophila]
MLTESFVAATLTTKAPVTNTSAALKDVGIFKHELWPQNTFRQGFKKSSSRSGCAAISATHVFTAQAEKAVVNVYSRERGNQEATVPFPEKLSRIAFAGGAAVLVLGTEEGRLILWEVATGRLSTSSAAHLQGISSLCITPEDEYIISGSGDTQIHVWSLASLISFKHRSDGFGNEEPSKSPIRSFSIHRSGISAIQCGHSTSSTNLVVSGSLDGTCHVWHVDTCQLLRTILLPTPAISIAIDPADRVFYFGAQSGDIFSWAVYQASHNGISSLDPSTTEAAREITMKDRWTTPSSDLGPANCLSLSYDGSSLLSGHSNGAVLRWDTGKKRISGEVTNLGQSVTWIQTLHPEGLLNAKALDYNIPEIVKPNLELSAQTDNGSCGVPSKYGLHARIPPRAKGNVNCVDEALSGSGFPQSMIEDALNSLRNGGTTSMSGSNEAATSSHTERLESEISRLKQQLAAINHSEQRRMERRLVRSEKRKALGLKKREAYFAAKKEGRDGDAAMKQWEEKEKAIDAESDDDELADDMDTE